MAFHSVLISLIRQYEIINGRLTEGRGRGRQEMASRRMKETGKREKLLKGLNRDEFNLSFVTHC